MSLPNPKEMKQILENRLNASQYYILNSVGLSLFQQQRKSELHREPIQQNDIKIEFNKKLTNPYQSPRRWQKKKKERKKQEQAATNFLSLLYSHSYYFVLCVCRDLSEMKKGNDQENCRRILSSHNNFN